MVSLTAISPGLGPGLAQGLGLGPGLGLGQGVGLGQGLGQGLGLGQGQGLGLGQGLGPGQGLGLGMAPRYIDTECYVTAQQLLGTLSTYLLSVTPSRPLRV